MKKDVIVRGVTVITHPIVRGVTVITHPIAELLRGDMLLKTGRSFLI